MDLASLMGGKPQDFDLIPEQEKVYGKDSGGTKPSDPKKPVNPYGPSTILPPTDPTKPLNIFLMAEYQQKKKEYFEYLEQEDKNLQEEFNQRFNPEQYGNNIPIRI